MSRFLIFIVLFSLFPIVFCIKCDSCSNFFSHSGCDDVLQKEEVCEHGCVNYTIFAVSEMKNDFAVSRGCAQDDYSGQERSEYMGCHEAILPMKNDKVVVRCICSEDFCNVGRQTRKASSASNLGFTTLVFIFYFFENPIF
uniref:Protein quiver n=1 Tax=Panagrolaimus sp. JU765 TaxID=591449 RepID=A0AC34QEJ7_9BILA